MCMRFLVHPGSFLLRWDVMIIQHLWDKFFLNAFPSLKRDEFRLFSILSFFPSSFFCKRTYKTLLTAHFQWGRHYFSNSPCFVFRFNQKNNWSALAFNDVMESFNFASPPSTSWAQSPTVGVSVRPRSSPPELIYASRISGGLHLIGQFRQKHNPYAQPWGEAPGSRQGSFVLSPDFARQIIQDGGSTIDRDSATISAQKKIEGL